VYDFTQRAYSNREGYTWTPMYLQHCPDETRVPVEIFDRDWDHARTRESKRKLFVPISIANNHNKQCFSISSSVTGKPQGNKRSTSYSKFMRSPWLKRQSSNLVSH
jgi:hypothetical protein